MRKLMENISRSRWVINQPCFSIQEEHLIQSDVDWVVTRRQKLSGWHIDVPLTLSSWEPIICFIIKDAMMSICIFSRARCCSVQKNTIYKRKTVKSGLLKRASQAKPSWQFDRVTTDLFSYNRNLFLCRCLSLSLSLTSLLFPCFSHSFCRAMTIPTSDADNPTLVCYFYTRSFYCHWDGELSGSSAFLLAYSSSSETTVRMNARARAWFSSASRDERKKKTISQKETCMNTMKRKAFLIIYEYVRWMCR